MLGVTSVLVGTACELGWTFITSISVVLGLRVTCTASLAARLAVSVNPLVSSVSLTSESKRSRKQYVMTYWEKCNSVADASLLSI